MKKYILIAAILVGVASGLKAQNTERIQSLKIAFLTEKLNLTSDEAKVFWPVFNKYEAELKNLRKTTKSKLDEEMTDFESISDSEAEEILKGMLAFKSSELELLKKYTLEFKKVLPVKKVVLLYRAENDFKREIIKKLAARGKR